jgi:hypothetical protein
MTYIASLHLSQNQTSKIQTDSIELNLYRASVANLVSNMNITGGNIDLPASPCKLFDGLDCNKTVVMQQVRKIRQFFNFFVKMS